MQSGSQSGGGTYIHFRAGAKGGSGAHMRYISRPSATEDRESGSCGFVAQNLPPDVTQAHTYEELRDNLISFAKVREEEEKGRSHYRCRLSFEREIAGEKARAMVREWLQAVFPNARSVAFFHYNTRHTHTHLWIDARQTNERKLDISPHASRQLGATWNRIYCREMGRDEREWLNKVEETRAYKQARARGQEPERPMRVNERNYGSDKSDVRGADRNAYPRTAPRASAPERERSGTESAVRGEPAISRFDQSRERTLREVVELREDLTRLGQREPSVKRDIPEPER